MEFFEDLEQSEKTKNSSLLGLIRRFKETYLSDDEDSDDDEATKENPLLIENALRSYAGKTQFSDVVFIVENEKKETERIPAHRMLLAARSPVFEAMLYPNPELEQKELPSEIIIKDTNADVFRLLLQAIYTDKPQILAKQIVDAVECARKYQVATLKEACMHYMSRGLTYENACELLMCATPEDRVFAMRFIEEHCEEIIQKDPFFSQLSLDDILFIVRSNRLCVTEVELFKGIMVWGEAECKRNDVKPTKENLRIVLEPIMAHIRFPLMSTNDLAMVVSPTGALDSNDLIAVFTYCSSQVLNMGTVARFCTHPRQTTFKGENMKWCQEKSAAGVTISSDCMSVKPTAASCGQGKIAITNHPYPKFGRHYFEVTMDHEQGCYDSVGVCNKKFDSGCRLGDTKNSWAIRVYGPTTDTTRFGAIHGGHKDFFKGWKKNDRIGVQFDARRKTLSIYQNGKYIGTPFDDVQGEIYPCVEICHTGSFIANFRATQPRG